MRGCTEARCAVRGRPSPPALSQGVFNEDEIKAAYVLTMKAPPAMPPRLNDVIRRVAMLGGFLARKGDDEPGVLTLWLCLQRIVDASQGSDSCATQALLRLVCNAIPLGLSKSAAPPRK